MLLELQNNDDAALARRGLKPPEEVRSVEIDGWVDTGAAQLVLPKAVTDVLGVPVIGEAKVRFADGRPDVRPVVGEVRLRMGGRDGVFKAIVEPGREDALIGGDRTGRTRHGRRPRHRDLPPPRRGAHPGGDVSRDRHAPGSSRPADKLGGRISAPDRPA